LFVIAPVISVTGLVINEVVPLPMVPPLVTVLVFVVWAEALKAPNVSSRQKTAVLAQRRRGAEDGIQKNSLKSFELSLFP
jgi:hypothetical protein